MQVALLQYDIAWEDKAANHRRMEGLLGEAGLAPGAFVLLPELSDTGFSMNLEGITGDGGRSVAWARDLARTHGWTVQMGHAEAGPDGLGRNCATIVTPEGEAATYIKVHPVGLMAEGRHYAAGHHLLLTRVAELEVAPLICYDLRFPELFRLASVAGAELFSVGACWPIQRKEHWRSLLIARALEGQAWTLGCNRVGTDPSFTYGGTSMIVSPEGVVLAEADHTEECVLSAQLDVAAGRRFREQFPVLDDTRDDLLGAIKIIRGTGEERANSKPERPQN